jgi:methyl-accepting chemotaxis protein
MSKTEQTKSLDIFSDQELDAQLLHKMSKQMQTILEIRGDLSLKVAMRVTFLTRFIMIALGGIVISMLLFLIIISTRISDLSKTVITMNELFGKMTTDMVVMHKHVATMEAMVGSMPSMQKNLVSMDLTMTEMNDGMQNMSKYMQIIRQEMDDMDQSLYRIDGSFNKTQGSLLKMQSDVDKLSSPMRMFNTMTGR